LTLKNNGALLLLSQTVKLPGWSHGPSRALSHDQAHVPSPDHDSSPLMTRHVVSPFIFFISVTLSFSCLYPYRQLHFLLDATLSFSSSCSVPATLLTGPHIHSPFSIFIPVIAKHVQTWSVHTLVAI